jgi:hypothetical protein
MAKRKRKTDAKFLGLLFVLAILSATGKALIDSGGILILGLAALVIVIAVATYQATVKRKRLAYLRQKYADETIVQRILQHEFWEGQTSAQLVDSLGNPASVDRKMLKSISREVWKYDQRGVNRYGLRITLDSDVVVGWDQKSR